MDEKENLWQRVRGMYAYMYQNYLNDYDYFHIAGDTNFVIVEVRFSFLIEDDVEISHPAAQNLRHFLGSLDKRKEPGSKEEPWMIGQWRPVQGPIPVVGGSPGYSKFCCGVGTS